MTNWVDALGATLTEEQKERNLQNARRLRDAELIEGRAPDFFRAFSSAAHAIVVELNQKLGASLGGVTEQHNDGSLTLASHGPIESVVVVIRLNMKGQQVTVRTTRKGNRFVPEDAVDEALTFRINDIGVMFVERKGESVYDAAELASRLLKETFIGDLFRPY